MKLKIYIFVNYIFIIISNHLYIIYLYLPDGSIGASEYGVAYFINRNNKSFQIRKTDKC